MEARFRANEDRISRLPDELILLILSFLDTKYAVQTSVLSNRWKFVSKLVSHLKFDSHLFRERSIFVRFVNKVLSNRDRYAGISSITYASTSISIQLAERIIRYARSHNAEYLNIIGDPPMINWVSYSPLIFCSPHLKKLSLSVNVEVKEASLNFPSLTSLDLEKVLFKCENPNKIANPFSRLSSLRELALTECFYTGLEVFDIYSPRLQKLNILTNGREETKFMLSTPDLLSFTYTGYFPLSLLANDLRCLEYVGIHIPYIGIWLKETPGKRFVRDMITMFRQLCGQCPLQLH